MSVSQHIHVIDGKSVSFDEKTCPYCHPNATDKEQKQYPTVYRKGMTIVVQPSKGLMITDTYWSEKNVILHSTQRMQHDASGKVVIGADKLPVWQKDTMRLSMWVLEQYVMELSKLLRDVQQKGTVPQRA
jgi:hypothetical protein